MARTVGKLSALKVAKTTKPGLYADGGGLYLQVRGAGKSWIYRFTLGARSREMGLGPLSAVGLLDARTKAAECRRLRQEGIDPIEARKAFREKASLDAASTITFNDAVSAYIKSHSAAWRNAKHVSQWRNTLATYAGPVIGGLSVQSVDTKLVLQVIEPIWTTKTETANRIRGRIEAVIDWATARGFRTGENPARWRGHLDKLLAAPSKLRVVRHHPALPYAKLPEFFAELKDRVGVAARALEFVILTATRTSEVIGATWAEVNLTEKTWVVAAERMKSGKEHRVPLAAAALSILRNLSEGEVKTAGFIFPVELRGKPLSNMAMKAVLKRMGRADLTVHGFRSTFRDWASERTNVPSEVAEMALAHAISSKVEAAYRRGDLFEKRRRLMADWEKYCMGKVRTPNIVSFQPVQTNEASHDPMPRFEKNR
jgi:integrase